MARTRYALVESGGGRVCARALLLPASPATMLIDTDALKEPKGVGKLPDMRYAAGVARWGREDARAVTAAAVARSSSPWWRSR